MKTRFRVEKLEFFRIQYESHDQTLAARGSKGHYLNSLGTDFSYHFYFLKKIIFWVPMPSKSQNYVEFAYKMLGKCFFEMKNFKVLKIVPNMNRWCGIVLGVFRGSRNAFPMIFEHSKLVFEKSKNSKFALKMRFQLVKLNLARENAFSSRKTRIF